MESRSRKLSTAIVPLGVAAVVVGSWWAINSHHSASTANSAIATSALPASSGVVVPQDPAHEKAALEEQLKRNPGHPPILMRLAELEQQAGHPSGAVPYWRKVLDKDPKNADARLELGRSLYDSGDADGALAETKRLLADHPSNVDGLYNLGAIYANRNQFNLARQAWKQALAIDPKSESGRKAQDGLAKLGPEAPGAR